MCDLCSARQHIKTNFYEISNHIVNREGRMFRGLPYDDIDLVIAESVSRMLEDQDRDMSFIKIRGGTKFQEMVLCLMKSVT